MNAAKTVAYVVLTVAVAVFAVKTFIYGGSEYEDPNDSPLYESMLKRSINTSFKPSEFVLGRTPMQPQGPQHQYRQGGGPADQRVKLGLEFYQKKEYATAAGYFEAASQQAPDNVLVLQYLAATYNMMDRKDKVAEISRKLAQLTTPGRQQGHQYQPQQPRQGHQHQPQPPPQGRRHQAQQFQGRPEVGPPPELRSAAEYLGAAMSLYTQGRFKEAIPLFDAAIKADPKNPQPYFSLANCYLVSGDEEKMLQYYKAAAEVAPQNAAAQYYLGVAYAQTSKPEEARSAFRKALALDPEHTHAHEGLAQLLKAEGKHEEAMKEFQYEIDLCKKLIKENPEEPLNYNRLAQFYLRNDIYLEEGVELITKALQIDPDRAATLATAAQLHFKKGDTAKAIELIDKAIEKKTDRSPYYEMMKRHFLAAPKEKPEKRQEGEKKEEETK